MGSGLVQVGFRYGPQALLVRVKVWFRFGSGLVVWVQVLLAWV